ncbi:MAG: coproporphyrinogen dehydrogenase HemZ [Clostridiales bacterium]|nr:coproporphyrinogen dehydrogenase HemZ [Clostridiales bacterium]
MNTSRIEVRCEGHDFFYPVSDILRLFTGAIPREEHADALPDTLSGRVVCDVGRVLPDGVEIVIRSRVTDEIVETFVETSSFPGEEENEHNACGDESCGQEKSDAVCINREALCMPLNREVKRQLYEVLSIVLKKSFPWGSLTGIRPTQVARELVSESKMTDIYGVRADKAHLAFITRDEEDRVLDMTAPDSLHVYIGIPFCPTRCAYCSFVAQEAPRKTSLLPSYVDAMRKEMERVLPNIAQKIETLYIGGGTPTVLDATLLSKLMDGIKGNRAFDAVKEICVEAGRPDTITEEKLRVLRAAGITRICINPQTLCDATLLRVGRRHTADDFVRAFEMAREMGFSVINTDLIAGLPGESAEEFCESLDRILDLAPENVTVHSLSKKRRSDLTREEILLQEKEDLRKMETMLTYASSGLMRAGYSPYYLYKQKDTLGGHENVGYQKGGTPCVYNVAMMSDRRSVLSFGAGGMSKRVFPGDGDVRVERCSCIKDPIQYIANVEAMAQKKRAFFA